MSTLTITAPFNPVTGDPAELPTIPKEVLIEKLRTAIELMNDGGKHWTRGAYRQALPDGSMSYCAVGAVAESLGWDQPDMDPMLNALFSELLRTLGEEPQFLWMIGRSNGPPKMVVDAREIISFNDTPGRTWTEVKSLFESTIERLERADD